MKKQLLFGSAILATVAVNAQTNKAKPSGIKDDVNAISSRDIISRLDGDAKLNSAYVNSNNTSNDSNSELKSAAQPTVGWSKVSGSMNIYGMLVTESRPLQYKSSVNAVTFIHRKSASYTSSPVSNSGSIVGSITTDWGATWDSTCIWADGTNLARYPQGGLYSAPGNTNANQAYFVGTGPVTGGSGWLGNWYASKSVSATPKNQPGADMQFMSTVPTQTAVGKHEFSRLCFSSTNDGFVRSIGMINTDGNGTTFAAIGRRGAAVVKGTFNAGAMVWSSDSIICDAAVRTDGGKTMNGTPRMAWNEAGTVGYVVFIGMRNGATGSERSWQPIIYKTTNSGASWAPLTGIDFDLPLWDPIKNAIPTIVSSTTTAIPFFNEGESIAVSVDKDNKLHIFTTITGTARTHVDSVTAQYINTLSVNPGDEYAFGHVPGQRPYLYDFIGDGTAAWGYKLIDSMSTEGMSGTSGESGYNDNPWDADAANSNAKVFIDARLQLSRTPSGDGMVYSWTESDTNSTNGAKKFNNKPNLKVKAGYFQNGSTYVISPSEWNLTAPPVNTAQGAVNAKAWFHYQSPTSGNLTVVSSSVSSIRVPFTITNSSPLGQLTSNVHYYTSANVDFITVGVGVKESVLSNNVKSLSVYPNPASNNAFVNVTLVDAGNVTVTLVNTLGQVVSTSTEQANAGANTINVNLNGVSTGIYFVNVKAGNQTSTAKLIVE